MSKFRKKPVVVDAIRFTGKESFPAILEWADYKVEAASHKSDDGERIPIVEIQTLEGTMTALPGDWIIRGVKGELYPCKADIFAATYEAVEA